MAAGVGTGLAIAGGSAVGSYLTGKSASDSAKATAKAAAKESGRQFDISMEEMRKAAKYLEDQGVPPEEAQHLALQYAQMDADKYGEVETDPRLRSAQMDALSAMQKYGESGLTAEEQAQQGMMMRGVSSSAQARDKSILQNMAERGMGGSGAELIQRLQSSQSGADRASMEQAQLAGQVQNRALDAMMRSGQLGGQIRGQEYGMATAEQQKQMSLDKFNQLQKTGAANDMERARAAANQRAFENELQKRQGVAAARTGTAQAGVKRSGDIMKAGQTAAAGEIAGGAATTKLIGDLGVAGIKAYSQSNKDDDDDYAVGGVVGTAGYREYEYQDGGMVPQAPDIQAPNSNGGYAGGGLPVPDSGMEEDNRYLQGDIVPGDNFEGDRVDAKVNSGEMVLNLEQQQRLMELLKGLRDLKGLGDEDIISGPGGEAPMPPMPPQGMPPMPPQGMPPMPPAAGPAPIPDGQQVPFNDGGMVPSEYKTPSEAKPRGLHSSLDYERKAEEKSGVDSKERKARIKAYEVLANGGK